MERAACILVVDDEEAIRSLLRSVLVREGFEVLEAQNAADALVALTERHVDLVTLDLGLGSDDGLKLLRQVNDRWPVPVILVSARSDEVDRIIGLEFGADDYIVKPFNLREVLARIRAVLRRSERQKPVETEQLDYLYFDRWRFSAGAREVCDVSAPSSGALPLTTGEFNLLAVLIARPGRPLTREALLDLLKGDQAAPFDRAIDTLVARLRKKIERDPNNPVIIKTVRGIGYVFAATLRR